MKHIIFHDKCSDGFGAAYSAWRSFGNDLDVKFHPVNYGDDFPEFGAGDLLYILDFSYAPEVITSAAQKAGEILLLDHHDTAREDWNKLLSEKNGTEDIARGINWKVVFDMERSGARMAWDHFMGHMEDTPGMILHIEDRDLWRFNIPNTKAFIRQLNAIPQTTRSWDRVARMDETAMTEFMRDGIAVQSYYEQQLNNLFKDNPPRHVRLFELDDPNNCDSKGTWRRGLMLNANPLFASEAGERLTEMSGTFGMTYSIVGDKVHCSLRCKKPYEVQRIAKTYGGGGHKQSAGFKLSTHRFFRDVFNQD
jgi:oligoribonuclease NrnB/cAMP/cGMP phosphodiesterase (DHH superfamily)